MTALAVADLEKRYPTGVEALRGVSLDIEAGEFFGLLGPNGAGKSTLIHCCTGLATPTAGSIRIFGNDAVNDYEEARLAVGLAPQDVNLDWFLTAAETLDYHGGYFGMPKRERRERTEELLDAFSLTEKRNERTRTLSGGMKRRLILARALMHRPRVLILDEPTAGVDVELRLELWRYVQRINEEGTTILLDHALPGGGRAAVRPHRLHPRRAHRGAAGPARAGRRVRRRRASRTPTSSWWAGWSSSRARPEEISP